MPLAEPPYVFPMPLARTPEREVEWRTGPHGGQLEIRACDAKAPPAVYRFTAHGGYWMARPSWVNRGLEHTILVVSAQYLEAIADAGGPHAELAADAVLLLRTTVG